MGLLFGLVVFLAAIGLQVYRKQQGEEVGGLDLLIYIVLGTFFLWLLGLAA